MAGTSAGRRLTEAHRLAQARLGVATVSALRRIWRLLEPGNLDGTFDHWLEAALPIIDSHRSSSSDLASRYLTLFKQVEAGKPLTPVLAGSADTRAITTSLLVTGPLSVKRAMSRGIDIDLAMDVAEAASAASGMRYALDGGRETILASLRADRDARGFTRVASGNACNFCEDLTGNTFGTDEVFPAHDGCSCTSEPVYR